MEANLDDSGFMDGMQTMMGMEPKQVEDFLEGLDNDSLLALTDAISKGDKEAATAIVQSYKADVHVNSLFRGSEIDDDEPVKKKKKPIKPPEDHVFAIGDDVAIRSTDRKTGHDDFVSATVFQPNAPGDTIGVKIQGKPKMVEKDEVYALNEMGVMGMVGIPNLQRMQQLAGIGAVTQTPLEVEPAQPKFGDTDGSLSQAVCAIEQLENILPNIRLADLKVIRQRIAAMQTSMNESIAIAMPSGRPRKS